MAAVKTYVLSPNFTYHPNTTFRLGDIIADPADPTRPLSNYPGDLDADTERHVDFDATVGRQTTQSLHGGLWARFLETINTKLDGGASTDVLQEYTMDSLETVYFKKQPTDEEAAVRIKSPRVQAAINAGILYKQPVYMITGLKIAKGFRLNSRNSVTRQGNVAVEAPLSTEVTAGLEIGSSRTDTAYQTHRSGSDIVFAYQLHIIASTGWRAAFKRSRAVAVDATVYKPKAAFLSEDDEHGNGRETFEIGPACQVDLDAIDESLIGAVLEVTDGGMPLVCLVLNEY